MFTVVEDGEELFEDRGVSLFLVAVAGTMPRMDLTRTVAALIMRSASEMDGAEQCPGYNLPTAVVIPRVSLM